MKAVGFLKIDDDINNSEGGFTADNTSRGCVVNRKCVPTMYRVTSDCEGT